MRSFILIGLLATLGACGDTGDDLAREVALTRVSAMSDQLIGPGVASDVVARCVVDGADLQELVILAGPSESAAQTQAAEIVARPQVATCIATGVLQG